MTLPRRCTAGLLLSASLLLAACPDRTATAPPASAPASAAAPGPRDVAMARGKVEVQGGLLEVMAQLDGIVESVAVQEGDRVKQGQVLLRLAPDAAATDAGLAKAELQLAQARRAAAQARLPAARRLASRLGEAAQAGAAEPQRADEARQAQRDAEAAVAVAGAEVAVARQRLRQVQALARRQTVAAAQDGTVVRLQVQPGARVSAQGGKALLVLMPQRPLVVRAELNERYVAAVKPGMWARISVETDSPNGGRSELPQARVTRISPLYGASRLDDETALRGNVRVVDCFLEFDQAPDLRVGQDVRVSFHE